jgi:hypothetical protein
VAIRDERVHGIDRIQDARGRHDLLALPCVLRVQRHVLDEADLVAGLAGPPCELHDLVVVGAADHHAVDLDRGEAGRLGRFHPREDLLQGVAPGHLGEAVSQARVAGDGRAIDPRRGQRSRQPVEEHPVRRERDVEVRTDLAEHPDQHGEIRANERLAARDLQAADTQSDEDSEHPGELFEREDLVLREPGEALGRHAVGAPEVATVRDGDPQVVGDTAEGVQERAIKGHAVRQRDEVAHRLSLPPKVV